jgi:hypothetical protein
VSLGLRPAKRVEIGRVDTPVHSGGCVKLPCGRLLVMVCHVEELCKLFALSEKRVSEDNRSLTQFRKNLVREITLHPIGKYGDDGGALR